MRADIGTIIVDDITRRSINAHLGLDGLATRDTIRSLYRSLAEADLAIIVSENLEQAKLKKQEAVS
jgi:hypothetical protein